MKNLAFIVFTAALCWMLPAAAFASGECTTDADCGDGFTCESYEEPCAVTPCADGDENCTETCESEEVYECQPAPPESCTSAADCTSDEVCLTYTWEVCDGSAPQVDCAEGQDCDAGTGADAEVSCTTESEGYCVPPYLAPCDKDSDCGTGFSCVEAESCACSGSDGWNGEGTDPDGSVDAGSDDGSDDAGSYEEDCTCSGTGEFYCELDETECTDASDCEGDLICDELPWSGGETTLCTSDPSGETTCEEDAGSSQEATTYCQPEDLDRWAALGGGSAGGAARLAENDPSSDGSSGGSSGGGDESAELVSSDVDRGGAGADSSGSSDAGAACASTGVNGAAPYGAAGVAVAIFGLFALRRRR